jgi:hypothetical protein
MRRDAQVRTRPICNFGFEMQDLSNFKFLQEKIANSFDMPQWEF